MKGQSGAPPARPFTGSGEFVTLVNETDWSRTPLGPVAQWPRTLVGYVQMVLDMPTPAIIFWGPEQTQIYNAGYATIMGPRHPVYFGASYRDCWPDTYPTIYPWMRRVLDLGEVIQVEEEYIPVTRYGFEEETYFSFTFSALRDDSGAIQGIFQPVFEVTDTVLGERRAAMLRELEPREAAGYEFDNLVRAIRSNPRDVPLALVFKWSASAGHLELAGGTHELAPVTRARVLDLAEQAFTQSTPLQVDHLEVLFGGMHVGPWPEPVQRGLVVPVGSAADAARGVVMFGISPRLHFDRKYRAFLELTASQMMARLSQGLERAARQREAHRRRQYLTELFTQAPAAIAMLRGPEHVFELSNPLYQQLIGEQREVLGKPFREALPELAGQSFFEVLDQVYRTGEPYSGTETVAYLDRDGSGVPEQVFFNFVYQPLFDAAGAPDGILVFAYEVTDQVRARQRVESLMEELKLEHHRKDEFLAMLAHELRNPLAAVHNAVALLTADPTVAGQGDLSRCVDIIGRQSRTLAKLVDDLLDVSRITRGLVELEREELDLRDVVGRAVESVQPLMERKDHRVELSLPADPVLVDGDPVRLEQVLVNLLSNAAKFTDPGGRLGLRLDAADGRAECRVQDSGIGLEPESIEQMFSLFGQAERALDRSQGGLGIGLTVARHLVELHGGTISASSGGPGAGSEFVVSLPLRSAPAHQPAPSPAQVASLAPLRVLVVDDNADAADTLAMLLRAAGHSVAVAYDGPAAVTEATAQRPDVVLLDIGLPGMDGYEVARRLKHEAGTRGARLAAMTGYGQERDRARIQAEGFDAHFVKPVELAALTKFMDRIADGDAGA